MNQLHVNIDTQPIDADPSRQFQLDVDLVIPRQGVTGIWGPSGSGKTTLLRVLAGLSPCHGRIQLGDQVWQGDGKSLPAYRRQVGYVFQEASLFSHLSVAGNLAFAEKRARRRPAHFQYQQIIEELELGPLLSRRTHQLSGGEAQRVSIGRALLSQPQLLLFDEPLSGIDAEHSSRVLAFLAQMKRSLPIPMLYVTHALSELAYLADHVIDMRGGRASPVLPVSDAFNRDGSLLYDERGPSVIAQGQITSADSDVGLLSLEIGPTKLWVQQAESTHRDRVGDTARVRIFANDVSITLNEHRDSSILNRLPSTVGEISPGPAQNQVTLRLDCGELPLLATITTKSAHELAIEKGQRVWAQIKASALLR